MTLIKRFLAAFAFLTIAPMPRAAALDTDAMGRSRAFFPAPGLALGAAYAAVAWALAPAAPALFATLAVVGAMCILTRCLHIDGLADLADAWGSAAPRERALEIMRDSRIGTFGVVAVALLLGAKAAAVQEIVSGFAASGDLRALRPLVLAPVAGRFAAVWLIQWFPYARAQGKGSAFLENKPLSDLVLAAALSATMAWFAAGAPGLLCLAATLGAAHVFGMYWNRRFQGLTGDIYGAGIEVFETAALWALALLP